MAFDAGAFSSFVRARYVDLLRSAYLLTGDRGSAEDLVQTALVRTWACRRRVKNIDSIEFYVRRSMINSSISLFRRRSHRERPSNQLVDVAVSSSEAEVDGRWSLWPHVMVLPPRQRAVIVLRYYEDRSVEQTAELLGCRAGTVKSQASRALTALRRRLQEETDRQTEPLTQIHDVTQTREVAQTHDMPGDMTASGGRI